MRRLFGFNGFAVPQSGEFTVFCRNVVVAAHLNQVLAQGFLLSVMMCSLSLDSFPY
jgi:hypothetical protein